MNRMIFTWVLVLLTAVFFVAVETGSAAADGVLIFQDDFNAEDNTLLGERAPVVGKSWKKIASRGSQQLMVKSPDGAVMRSGAHTAESSGVLYSAEVAGGYPSPNYGVSVRQVRGDTGDDYSILVLRMRDKDNMYAVRWNEERGRIFKKIDGEWMPLGSAFLKVGITRVPVGVKNGSTVTFKVEGDELSFEVDGQAIGKVYDSDHKEPGRAGVGLGAIIAPDDDMSGQKLDDFAVRTI